MSEQSFFPASIQDDGQYLDQRVHKLVTRSIGAVVAAFISSLVALLVIQNQGQLSIGPGAYAFLLLYLHPFSVCLRYLKTPEQFRNHHRTLEQLTLIVSFASVSWNLIGILILPGLQPDTMMIAISLFTVVATQHAIPFILFPTRGFVILLLNYIPLSIALMLVGEINTFALGISGIVFSFLSLGVITSLYRYDMDNIRKSEKKESSVVTEPDTSIQAFRNLQIRRLHRQSALSAQLQISIAFFLCYALRGPNTELLLWCWFLAFLSAQTIRMAEIVAYESEPERLRKSQWRILFGCGVVLGQLVWAVLPIIFYNLLSGFSLGVLSSVFIVVTVVSSLGLGTDRIILYLNSIICMISACFVFAVGGGIWAVVAFGSMGFVSLYLVLENMHRYSIDSINGYLLQKLNAYRAKEMSFLNQELTDAREHLIQANSSLESQVEERTQELNHQATHDMLTGLGNRYYFSHVVSEALEKINEEDFGFAIYLLDLDRFKEINDGLGHLAGDKVLIEISMRIQEACGKDIVSARWGGDEFVILDRSVSEMNSVKDFAQKLAFQLSQPIHLDKQATVNIGVSIGIALCPQHGITAESLLEHADIAVYRAKHDKSHVSIYLDDWGFEAAKRLQLTQKLRDTIEKEEIDIVFQPLISLATGQVKGFEALARWRDDEHSVICSPDVFIALAEESRLIYPLGLQVLSKACAGVMKFAPNSMIRVAVNVSIQQLESSNFIYDLENILRETGLAPERLELEITETMFAQNVETIRNKLVEIRKMGISISIDDFGTGYSSISYLRDFPLDTLKIDRSFVKDIVDGGEELYSSIISLAKGLNLSVIVEGIETEEQLKLIQQLGGDELQGYLFSKPIYLSEDSPWFNEYLNQPVELDKFFKFASGE